MIGAPFPRSATANAALGYLVEQAVGAEPFAHGVGKARQLDPMGAHHAEP
jgi:hypothetical protein